MQGTTRHRLARVLPTLIVAVALGGGAAQAQELTPPIEHDPGPTQDDFFDAGTLHTIRLVINPRDWDDLKASYQLNTYYACHFVWRNQIASNAGIRSRGTGSRSGSKPGLRVDFNIYDETQHLLGLKSVVLRNNVQDPSHLHERIGMQFFGRMGLPAPRQAHARLFVNDEYAGLYSIVESVDKMFLGRHFGEGDGYLYEYDYDVEDKPYRFEYRGADPALYSPKPFKPVTHELDPDPRPIAEMIRVINTASNAQFPQAMARYLDLERFVTHTAIEAFLSEMDGVVGEWGMNNFYWYRFERSTVSTPIAWDKSEAFKGGVDRGIWHNVSDVPSWLENRLVTRLMLVPELRGLYLDTLLRCAEMAGARPPDDLGESSGRSSGTVSETGVESNENGDAGWLEREVRRAYEQIRDAVAEDTLKPFTDEEFERAAHELIDFARRRSAFVERDVLRSPR